MSSTQSGETVAARTKAPLCPNDCSVPDVHLSRMKQEDLLQLILLRRPYRCLSCGLRFYKTELWSLVALALLVASLVIVGMLAQGAFAESSGTAGLNGQAAHATR